MCVNGNWGSTLSLHFKVVKRIFVFIVCYKKDSNDITPKEYKHPNAEQPMPVSSVSHYIEKKSQQSKRKTSSDTVCRTEIPKDGGSTWRQPAYANLQQD